MAVAGKFKCKNCGEIFNAISGSFGTTEEFRCVDCDKVKHINRKEVEKLSEEGVLKEKCKCGGVLKVGLKPKCPRCNKRNAEEEKPMLIID